ncbi:MAG: AmmeMemoRadiSam system protein B [Acidobacteria bacterium]|nr:MAG: AmmeMemoRadiSam system protein B [Acidobacteriota bacterium]RLE22355.1 MAG: AmmeMemoRadiSam system protein B [Acidobacteriota bacterium]
MRQAVFAGSFYSSDGAGILDFFKGVSSPVPPVQASGVICPHAGHIYSGKTAFKTLSSVIIPQRVLILCPNHRGMGRPLAVSPADAWDTPLGPVPVDMEFSEKIAVFPAAEFDSAAHRMEHSIEVQLPLLKMLNPDVKIAAVSVGIGQRDVLSDFADHIAKQVSDKQTLILASSDMSHFVPAMVAKAADSEVMERIKELDAEGMMDIVLKKHISMCGIYPAYVMLKSCLQNGASKSDIIEYTHSGKVTGDDTDVVAYLGVRIW